MTPLRVIVTGALVVAGSALAAPSPAQADVSPHCADAGYCLFSGTNFTGTEVTVSSGSGCRPVSGLGIATARSAARGYGDSYALQLYSDTTCTTSAGVVFDEVASTSATAYRLVPIPG
ncbi:peptidase inhibitor family I36 protein [Rugosimonospora africana]|uniref:Peptidase inhibitor family I36 n=1 Tax=Rugosimonospora africana TaxID=556532 RepID=A0A8J3QQF9_9ACTN|nr:peptidase inhibitor family I36 protein [Rugosimonospora africana]GIH15029.1 hypothetical protein Raf01_32010 [Rugosimonospora africana]